MSRHQSPCQARRVVEFPGPWLGLDIGEKRIGVAISDPTGWLATGRTVVRSIGRDKDVVAIAKIVSDEAVTLIVVGMPLSLNGTEGPQAEKVRRFGKELSRATTVGIVFWDERLTTVEARRYLRDAGMRPSKQRANIDAAAAEILLQNYLDYRRNR